MNTRANSSRRILFALGSLFAATTMLLGQAQSVSAQWGTNGTNVYYNGGNVGIGTNSPGAALEVVNSVAAGTGTARFKNTNANTQVILDSAASQNVNLRLDNNGNPAWYIGNLASNDRLRFLNSGANGNAEVLSILQSGNVGIGTATPNQKLGLQGMLGLYPQAHVSPTARGMFMFHGGTTGAIYAFNYPSGTGDPIEVSASNIDFKTFVGGSQTTRLFIANGGNVGIGTNTPSAVLDVNGNTNVTGNINVTGYVNAKYQDIAEWVPASRALPAGTVVTLDPNKSNHIEASSKAYDTRVAGVISAQPGIALGERGENKL
ncbi:MAG TPA: hypothetical protein VE977_11655, partial [Pyrinomonadaceae bacterium]|nr:hypothetical protein [Pyrinomonadaceae bacterium]